MCEDMARRYLHLRLSREACCGLREAIRPGVQEDDQPASRVEEFCRRLYLAHYSLEADADLGAIDFAIQPAEVMIINNFVSAEDGDWAKDVLHQTRQVLYELTKGHPAVRLATAESTEGFYEGLTLDPDQQSPESEPEPEANEQAEETPKS